MKSIYDILTQIKTDLATDIPGLLHDVSLADFDKYLIGGSRDADKKILLVYKNERRYDPGQNYLTMLIQAQIPGVTAETGAQYEDVIFTYLKEYDPADIGMVTLDGINADTWPMENSQGVLVLFTVSFSEDLDTCD